jgi:hypothetical protein
MARWLTLAVVVVVLAACGSSAAVTSSAALKGCGPAGAHTLASSAGARVYAHGGSVYACSRSSGRSYRLGDARQCIAGARVGPAAAAGAVVAYAIERCGVDTASAAVVVRRVTNGEQLSRHAAFSGPPGPESFQAVGSIVVNRSGHAAWIASDHSIVSHHLFAQVLETSGSGVRMLASGETIALGSLRLHGSRLTWTAGGAQHSATLG